MGLKIINPAHAVINAARIFTVGLAAMVVAATAAAQDRPIDFSSKGANVFGAPGAQSLSLPSQAAPAAVVARFLHSQGYLPETTASLVATREGRASRTGITHLRFAQQAGGLTVYGTYVKAAVNDDGELVHLIENLAALSAGALLPTAIDEQAALDAALDEVHPGLSVNLVRGPRDGNTTRFSGDDFFYRDPTVTRVAVPMESGVLQEGYLVETWTEEENLLHHTLIDGTGQVLQVELRTNNDSYNIFPDHPGNSTQTLTLGPGINPALPESPIGWLDLDGEGNLILQSSIDISGNNAHAYLDVNSDNGADPSIGFSIDNGNFVTVARPGEQPNTLINQEVAVQNLFYFNNLIHDTLYRHGFNEAAGNFQTNNFGNGGSGNDAVLAEAQDGNGFNNANFATPLDGPYSAPRMQMYLWNQGAHFVDVTGGLTDTYGAVGALFGPSPTGSDLTGNVVLVNDNVSGPVDGTPTDGCEPIDDVTGKVALIDRGHCDFVVKVKHAQDAGAVGVIVVNNSVAAISGMADNGDGYAITIPSVLIGLFDGDDIKEALAVPSTVTATLRATELMRDGDVDSDIVWHEYGHGLTWRMIGGMGGSMSGAIGEGMGDVLAILANDEHTVGEYSTDDPDGIRTMPYTGYSSYRTYGNFAGTNVHFNGEIYAAAVWRVWELFKTKYPDMSHNDLLDKVFGYLIDGMNYTPAGPAMEDMRDGILISATGSGDECLIWQGFAELGIGFGAEYNGGTVTESMAQHPVCTGGDNTAPMAADDGPYVVAEGGAVAVNVANGVLANDTDADSNSLTAAVDTWPAFGVLSLDTDGSFTYTHDGSETTSDSFTYKAYDGVANSDAATVDITITPVADPPAGPAEVAAGNADPPDGTAMIDWINGGGTVTGFEIRREKQNKRGMWKGRTTVATVGPAEESYPDASGNGTFRYQVRALNGALASDWMPAVDWVMVTVTTDGGGGDPGGTINCKKKQNRELEECQTP